MKPITVAILFGILLISRSGWFSLRAKKFSSSNKGKFSHIFFVAVAVTEPPDDDEDDEDDWDEADDDGKIYKNPRNSPSSDCPRDEEQATLLVCSWSFLIVQGDMLGLGEDVPTFEELNLIRVIAVK